MVFSARKAGRPAVSIGSHRQCAERKLFFYIGLLKENMELQRDCQEAGEGKRWLKLLAEKRYLGMQKYGPGFCRGGNLYIICL